MNFLPEEIVMRYNLASVIASGGSREVLKDQKDARAEEHAIEVEKAKEIAKRLEDITLEYGLFPPKADFFEDVYGIRPMIKKKKSII